MTEDSDIQFGYQIIWTLCKLETKITVNLKHQAEDKGTNYYYVNKLKTAKFNFINLPICQ